LRFNKIIGRVAIRALTNIIVQFCCYCDYKFSYVLLV